MAISANTTNNLTVQNQRPRPRTYLFAIAPGLICALLPLKLLLVISGIEGSHIIPLAMRDVAASAQLHSFTGIISNLGAFVWFAIAAICLFTRLLPHVADDTRAASFLGWSTILALYLWFDDFFLFHERLAPDAGISEKAVIAAFVTAVGLFFLRFWRDMEGRHNPWLLVAVALLAGSMAADYFLSKMFGNMEPWVLFVEDGLKWLGICAWATYYVRYCRTLGTRSGSAGPVASKE